MNDWNNKVDDYVKGLLNENEKKAFEMELSKNEALQREVKLNEAIVNQFKFDEIKQTINQARLENEVLDEKFQSVTQTIQQAKNENIDNRRKSIQLYRRLSIAAAFCLVLGASLYFANQNSNPSFITDIMVKESSIKNVTALKAEKIEGLVIAANQSIREKDYDQALSITNQLRKEEGFETDEILQNECYIYFKQKNYKKAERQLNSIKDLNLKNEVRWKLSQLYLGIDEKVLAKKQLILIEEGPYKKKAKKRLNKMK